MTTALDIITRALRSINVLSVGETPDASMAQDALDSLNDVLEGWANEALMVYHQTTESFPLVSGQASYTVGTGGDFNTVTPTTITSAYVRIGSVDYPLQILTQEQYAGIGLKNLDNTVPFAMYFDTDFPLSRLYFWCVPNTSSTTFFMNSLKPFAVFSSITNPVVFPSGYARAMRYALAAELMPEYGLSNSLIIEYANQSKSVLKRTNFKPSILSIDDAIPRGRINTNIYSRF